METNFTRKTRQKESERDISSDFIREHYKSACWARYVLPLLLSVEEILNKLSSRWSSLLNYFSPSASDSPDRLSQHWIYLNPSDQITLGQLGWCPTRASSSGLWCMENKWCKWNSVWHLLRREQMFRYRGTPTEVASLWSVKIPFLYPTINPPHFYHKHTNYPAIASTRDPDTIW